MGTSTSRHKRYDRGHTCLKSDSYTLLSLRLTSCWLLTRFGLFNADNGSELSSCARPEPPFDSWGLAASLPVADWLEVPPVEGTVPVLFFLMVGRRFFFNGGGATGGDSSFTSEMAAVLAAVADDSASGAAATTSSSPSGSSADKASSLARFDPPSWLRSRALVGCGLRSSCIAVSSSFSTCPLAFGAGFLFGLVSEREGDGS